MIRSPLFLQRPRLRLGSTCGSALHGLHPRVRVSRASSAGLCVMGSTPWSGLYELHPQVCARLRMLQGMLA